MTLLEALLMKRATVKKPGEAVMPVHPDVAHLAEILELRLQEFKRK